MDLLSDLQILANLQEQGPLYLHDLLCKNIVDNDNFLTNKNKEILQKYHLMYLTEDDIFEDNIKNYCMFLIKNDTSLFDHFIETNKTTDIDSIVNIIKNMLVYSNELIFDQKIRLYYKIFNSPYAKIILGQYEHGFFDRMDDTFIGRLLEIPDHSMKSWEQDILEIRKLLFFLFTEKPVSQLFLDWVVMILNSNIPKINLMNQNNNLDDYSNDTFLVNITAVMYIFWMKGYNEKRMSELNKNYLKSKNCLVKWYDKTIEDESTFKFFDQCFFILLNALRICYVPSICRSHQLHNVIIEIKNMMRDPFTILIMGRMDKKLETIENILFEDTLIAQNETLRQWIGTFYQRLSEWILTYAKDFPCDDILRDMNTFLLYKDQLDKINGYKPMKNSLKHSCDFLTPSMVKLMHLIVSSRKYLSNPEIRFSYIKILVQARAFNNIINTTDLFASFLALHNDFETYEMIYSVKLIRRICLYELLEDICFKQLDNCAHNRNVELELELESEIEIELETLDNILSKNETEGKKFLNILLNDTMKVLKLMDAEIKHFNQSFFDPRLNEIGMNLYGILIHYSKMIKMINYISNLEATFRLFKSGELLITYTAVINDSLKMLVDTFSFKFPFLDSAQIAAFDKQLNFYSITSDLFSVFVKVANEVDSFKMKIKQNIDNESIDKFKKVLNFLNSMEGFTDMCGLCDKLTKLINEFSNKHLQLEEIVLDYPDEFLDPLTYEVINDPVLLPNINGHGTDTFMEKSVIQKCLLDKAEHPFTREKLTIEKLNKYNEKEEIIDKLKKFVDNKKKWEKNIYKSINKTDEKDSSIDCEKDCSISTNNSTDSPECKDSSDS